MSNKRHKYFNKVPPFKPDPEHYTRKHHSWKAKVAYETEDEACEHLQLHPNLLEHGYIAYQCRACQKWHIGHASGEKKKTY